MSDRQILLIQCPSCQHTNTPGEQFCAACGVPLHLKPCPECGKVGAAAAKTCAGCGAAFPPLAADQYVLVAGEDAAPRSSVAPQQDDSVIRAVREFAEHGAAPANRAWPLIIVALVAGGIPFLWMYRANMPLPKAWQVQGHNAAGSAVEPTVVPPVLVPPPPTALPVEDKGKDKELAGQVQAEPAPAPVASSHPPVTTPVAKPPAKPIAKAVPRPTAEPPLPCTEALAAIDLCKPVPQSAQK